MSCTELALDGVAKHARALEREESAKDSVCPDSMNEPC
jgi:hypothetical protein